MGYLGSRENIEIMLHLMHLIDVCFDKSWCKKLSFSYRNNDIMAVDVVCPQCEREMG